MVVEVVMWGKKGKRGRGTGNRLPLPRILHSFPFPVHRLLFTASPFYVPRSGHVRMAQVKARSSGSAERPSLEGFPTDADGCDKADILELSQAVRRGLSATPVHGHPRREQERRGAPSQFEKALDGEIMFDGSSIEGFVRIEESDMLLKPDLETFRILPYDDEGGRVARFLCDIYTPDEQPFAGARGRRSSGSSPGRASWASR